MSCLRRCTSSPNPWRVTSSVLTELVLFVLLLVLLPREATSSSKRLIFDVMEDNMLSLIFISFSNVLIILTNSLVLLPAQADLILGLIFSSFARLGETARPGDPVGDLAHELVMLWNMDQLRVRTVPNNMANCACLFPWHHGRNKQINS